MVSLRLVWDTWDPALRRKWRYRLLGETVQKLLALVAAVEDWRSGPSTHTVAYNKFSVTLVLENMITSSGLHEDTPTWAHTYT